MRIQYISDIHLEFYKTLKSIPSIPVEAPILVLAGDVGYPTLPIYWEFLERCSAEFKHVILITGNHEYYHTNTAIKKGRILTIRMIDELIRSELERRRLSNIHFLHNSSVILEGIRFIGSTLWSNIPLQYEYEVSRTMNDFKQSFEGSMEDRKPLTVPTYNRMYNEAHDYIELQLKESTEQTVVITHHLPSCKMIDKKYAGSSVNCAFASNSLEELIDSGIPLPAAWICGHSHTPVDLTIEGVRCVMNPIGYPCELSKPNWTSKIDL